MRFWRTLGILLFVGTPLTARAKDLPPAFTESVHGLDAEATQLSQLYLRAKNCFPTAGPGESLFCTGFKLSEKAATALLGMNLKQCQDEIVKRGYRPVMGKKAPGVSDKDYADFLVSTKNAETYHQEKVVLFKHEPEPLTCVHELLHLYQRSPGLSSELAPENREKRGERVAAELARAVVQIEACEKRGEKDLAQRMADRLKNVLEQMKLWSSLSDRLDEKDVHGWLWLRCRHSSAAYCSPKQLDVALANLWVRKDFIPVEQLKIMKTDGARLISGSHGDGH